MMSKKLFAEADLAALKSIAAICETSGLEARWDDVHVLDARGQKSSVMARIYPAKEQDGVRVTAVGSDNRRVFDAPAKEFTPDGAALSQLKIWLAQQASK